VSADKRVEYFRQLIELGEKELVLTHANRDQTGGRREAGEEVRTEESGPPSPVSAPLPPAASRLSVGGPPMYGPGLVVDAAPVDDMFQNSPIAKADRLEQLIELIEACRRCSLGSTRQHIVPGEGNPDADFVCVGEAPGATEDEKGRPFVGRAGQLLNDILKAIGLPREEVFIMNVLKCRPPGNRDPEPLEAQACSPYLHRQLELIRPKVILALGKPAATTLLNVPRTTSLTELRGKVHRYRGTPLVVTYHPAALLRNPHWKAATWDDVRIARRILDGEMVIP
jgi:uracil-DNA glycosylase family 4